jgi:hypothetical protein
LRGRHQISVDGKPVLSLGGDGRHHLLRCAAGRLEADLDQLVGELLRFYGCRDLFGNRIDDLLRGNFFGTKKPL